MLARGVEEASRAQMDPASPFRRIAPFFARADIAFINLESPFSDRGAIANSRMIFRADPQAIAGLELAGIDVVSTANNHARDAGKHGLAFTLSLLANHGIAAVGTAASQEALREGVVLERNGARFGFLAYTYDQSNGNYPNADAPVAMLDAEAMREDVIRLRQRTDVVVVSMHAGVEYAMKPSARQIEFARAAIDAGATVVAGHHPHVVQPVERYRAGVIFYSLGNLVFDQVQRRETQTGLIAEVFFDAGRLESYRVHEVDIVETVPQFRSGS